jgi:hypothetical protein
MDPASLLDTSYFNVTWVDGEFWLASGKVTRATCGESIREQVKCEKRRSSRLEDVLRPLACQRSAEGRD